MSSLYTHKDYVKVRKLIVIAAGCYGCDPVDISGVKDTENKVKVIYLIKILFSLTDKQLGLLFQINKDYMSSKLESLSVMCLMDSGYKEQIMRPKVIYDRLELIDIANA